MRLLLVDNYDSFSFNLAHLFQRFGLEVEVRRNDGVSLDQIAGAPPDWICISPGPRTPSHAGISAGVVRRFAGSIPILGVCLGMQVINEVYGGRTVRAPVPVHGKRARVHHGGGGLLRGLPSPFPAARYHSLCIEIGSDALAPLARGDDGTIMALRHRTLQVHGVQFHPESFLGEYGQAIARNFLNEAPAFAAASSSAAAAG